jgi:molecular chaperone GrpE (heat shock protein)
MDKATRKKLQKLIEKLFDTLDNAVALLSQIEENLPDEEK